MLLTNNKVDILDGSTEGGGGGHDGDSGVVIGAHELATGGPHSGGERKTGYSAGGITRLENTHLDTTASGHSMLDSNRVRMMSPYLSYSTVISHAIQEFFEVRKPERGEPKVKKYRTQTYRKLA